MAIYDDFPRGVPGRDERNAPLGTAHWSFDAPPWHEGDILLGLDTEGRKVGHRDDRHLITVAGSRAGKGRSVIIPNLSVWPGSCVVLDPKGENATATARIRAGRREHKVIVIDPRRCAEVPDEVLASFNPLDLIDADDDDAIDLAAAIGDAIMIGSGDGKDIHWNESARQIFEGILLHVAATEFGPRRSLVRVRQLLTLGDPEYADTLNVEETDKGEYGPFDALWQSMSSSIAANGAVRDVIAGAANSIRDMGENERGSVLSTARRNTKFIESPWMRRCLQGGSLRAFNIDELKDSEHGLSVYICLPARFIATHSRFLRLVLNLILYRMEAQGLAQPRCGHPCLFILDEFAAVGKLETIEKAAGLMAGYGVKLWPFLQDLGQLKRHYKESWETFMGNAGLLQFFANSDMTTLEWLSKRLGQTEVIRETHSSSDATTTGSSKSQSRTDQSGWSRSTGKTEGQQAMADLSRLAAQDGGSGLVPFLARSGASDVSHSLGQSSQDGQSGGESTQQGDSVSSGNSRTETRNEGIHLAALVTPDEIARIFDRKTERQIILINGVPLLLQRLANSGDAGLKSSQTLF
jgi:type IV secretion system protein VirD4